MRNSTIKVMVGRKITRVQEDTGDTVKVYTAEQWKEELKKRSKKTDKPKGKISLPTVEEANKDVTKLSDKGKTKTDGGEKSKSEVSETSKTEKSVVTK